MLTAISSPGVYLDCYVTIESQWTLDRSSGNTIREERIIIYDRFEFTILNCNLIKCFK
jgi:hypothetical protein